MVDPVLRPCSMSTAPRRLILYVIESGLRTDRACSCDLNGVLTLRKTGRSEHEAPPARCIVGVHQV